MTLSARRVRASGGGGSRAAAGQVADPVAAGPSARAGTDRLLAPAFGLVCLYALVTMLAWSALFPVLPLYVRGPLEGGDFAVGVVMSGALLAAALVQPVLGRFADRRGRRLLLVGGPILFASAVAMFPLAESQAALFGLRAAAGLGDAAFMVGAVTLVSDIAPEGRRGEAYSIFSLAIWAGMGLGPVVGDFVLRAADFDTVWLVCAGFSIAGAVTALFLPETRAASSPSRSGLSFFNRHAAIPGVVLILEMIGFSAFLVYTPLYARELGMQGAGLVLLVNATVLVLMRVFGRRLPDRLGARGAASAGLLFAVLGLAIPATFALPVALYIGAASFGVGHALLYPALFMLAVDRAPASERSAALGSLKACEAIGFAVGASTLGLVASLAGYGGAFAIAAVATLAGLAPLWLLRQRRRSPELV